MQNPFKIILSILGLVLFFSCEQHYYFLNKVKVNTDEISLKTVNRLPQQSLNISKNADSNDIANKNVNRNIELAKTDFNVDTPKPFIIKKLPVVEKEISVIKNQEGKPEPQKPKEKRAQNKILYGILLIIIGAALQIYLRYYFSKNSVSQIDNEADGGCGILLLILLNFGSYITGLILIIIGIVQSF